jgi:hypothetical protein
MSRGCADDVGVVLRQLSFLKKVAHTCEVARKSANLSLNLSKTVLIPLGCAFSDRLVACIREWLHINVPSWAGVKIAPHGKYLGFYLGPSGGPETWVAPVQKFRDRVDMIRSSSAGPAVAAYTYSTRAIPCLGYQMQLSEVPPKLIWDERWILHKLFHIPSTVCAEHFHCWHHLGAPKVPSLAAISFAAIARTARQTVFGVPDMYNKLRESVYLLPYAYWNFDKPEMDFGTWPSFASTLHRSLFGVLPPLLSNVRELAQQRSMVCTSLKVKWQSIFPKKHFWM